MIPEETTRISIASQIAATGNLDPYWYGHPATLINYFLAGIYKLVYFFQSSPFTRLTYSEDHAQLVIIGRATSRIIAAACGPLTYLLARSILPIRLALLATALTILNPLFITHAHRARADHLLTLILLTTGLITASTRSIKNGLVPLAFLAGLGVTFKYLAASVLGSIQILIAIDSSQKISKKYKTSIKSLIIFSATILITSPYLYLHANKAFSHFTGEVSKQSTWNPGAAFIKFLLINAYGYSAIAGVIILILVSTIIISPFGKLQRLQASIPQATLTKLSIIYIPFISIGFAASTYNSTWLTPAIPYLSICITVIMHEFYTRAPIKIRWLKQCLIYIVIGLLITSQANKTLAIHYFRRQIGSTTESEHWLKSNEGQLQMVLLLQPSNSHDAAGSFPRFNSKEYELFIANPEGGFSRVCEISPEQWTDKNSSQHLIHTDCFPQPIFATTSNKPIEELLQQFDLVVTSKRYSGNEQYDENSTAVFSPPTHKIKLGYSPFNFPQGDSGAWKTINIYKKN